MADDVPEQPIPGSSGAATAAVVRLVGTVTPDGRTRPFSLVRKAAGHVDFLWAHRPRALRPSRVSPW